MASTLETALRAYDGKSVTILSEAQHACRTAAGYMDDLVRLTVGDDAGLSSGASWILSDELKNGARMTDGQLAKLASGLPALPDWQSALHLCQSLEHQPMDTATAARVADWADGLRDHPRPFLRAWSCHLIVKLAAAHSALAPLARAALQAAAQDSAASVRARARKLT